MSEKDKIIQRDRLNKALKESFRKMLDIKKKLGLPIVTTDSSGKPVIMTAEEAQKLVDND